MTIIRRSVLVAWGRNPPPDLASIVDGRVVTWAEVMENRRKRQAEQLRRKREWFVYRERAYKLWVAYFDQDLMGGWQAMLYDWRGRDYSIWIDRDRPHLRGELIEAFPLVLPLGKDYDNHWPAWEQWKVAFATAYERRRHDRKPLGVAYVWWDGRNPLRCVS